MANHTELTDEVLKALEVDPDVPVVGALRGEQETFVIGARDTHGEPWGTMMFVIALEDQRGSMGQRGHETLNRLKERLSIRSSTRGTAWYGVASTVETAVRISKGEVQIEPPSTS